MWKPPTSILGCCLAVLPLIGCAGSVTALPQDGAPVPTVTATPHGGVYATGPAAPAAVLVFMPGTDARSHDDFVPSDPAFWTAQGFDVVMPQPSWNTRLIADQESAIERVVASARLLADAPIWLVGPDPAIEAAMPQLGPGQVSGVVVTSVTSIAGSCIRSVFYSSPGNGAEPRMVVKTSGDACGASPPYGLDRSPSSVAPMPQRRPNAPRIIEASIPADHTAQWPLVQRLAAEIKAVPSS